MLLNNACAETHVIRHLRAIAFGRVCFFAYSDVRMLVALFIDYGSVKLKLMSAETPAAMLQNGDGYGA